jgi:hypothetical protein
MATVVRDDAAHSTRRRGKTEVGTSVPSSLQSVTKTAR